MKEDLTFPLGVRIENTNYCNANCIMCPQEKLTRQKGYMTFELFKSLIDECAEYGIFSLDLHGFGEPLLDSQLVKKIKYAKEKGIKNTYIITNASLLKVNLAKEIVLSGLDKIGISFFGKNKTEYESIHRGLKYEGTLKNINDFIRIKNELKGGKPQIVIKGLKHYKFNFLGRICGYPLAELFSIPDIKFRLKWKKYAKVQLIGWHNYSYGRNYNAIDYSIPLRQKCGIIENEIMQILWNGDVVSCCRDFDGKLKFGNVFNESIREVWNEKSYQYFRKTIKSNKAEDYPFCYSCDNLKPYK